MASVQVTAESRQVGHKGNARQLRMKGMIPAVVYGEGKPGIPITLHGPAFEQMLRHISSGNQILDLTIEGRGGAPVQVLIKDVQRNPMDQRILHVDLQHISMTHKVRVHVPIQLRGTPAGVKEGRILEHLLRELDVECLPGDIPESVTLDVSGLARAQSIHVRDVQVPPGVHVHDAADRVIATVAGKMKEEEAPAAAPAEGAEAPAAEGKEGKGEAAKPKAEAGKAEEKEKGKGKEKG
ncbi:MAG: 50S ribosomal protein L25 [Candidatus Eisenbacteria bacterium]|nr:50S ribosomal protein L25 [Candidatus Eisenbacteria bacterium]